ncbi:hypothetical protein AGMMS50256_24770 [Betaproteobacteria bacterium]|nr:hypothetical protein AGMMS50256_24770 [Betaproteobacteria bacterium]
MSATIDALNYLYRWEHELSFEGIGGLAFEGLLRHCRLDYSVASLSRIDVFLGVLRKTKKVDPGTFLDAKANKNLLFLLASYTGEVISRSAGCPVEWYRFDEMLKIDPAIRPLGKGFHTFMIGRLPPKFNSGKDNSFFLPLSVLGDLLLSEHPDKSIAASAALMLHAVPRHNTPPEQSLPPLPPQSMLDVSARLAKCTPEERQGLRTVRPDWLFSDPDFAPWFDHADALLASGRVVWGAPVQADEALYKPEYIVGAPGDVVYDPEGRVPPDGLKQVAQKLFSIKGQIVKGNEPLTHYTTHLADGRSRVFGAPIQVMAYPLKASSTWFDQHLLPDGMLSQSCFPLLVSDEHPGLVRILPTRLWPASLREVWLAASEARFGVRHTPESIKARVLEAQQTEIPALAPVSSGLDAMNLYEKGRQYFHGRGVKRDYDRARQLWEQVVELAKQDGDNQGSLLACNKLGTMYESGTGVEKDSERARAYFLSAATQGLAAAQYNLGKWFLSIDNKNADLIEAEHWLRQAADQGDAEARSLLLECGMEGGEENEDSTEEEGKGFWKRLFGRRKQ